MSKKGYVIATMLMMSIGLVYDAKGMEKGKDGQELPVVSVSSTTASSSSTTSTVISTNPTGDGSGPTDDDDLFGSETSPKAKKTPATIATGTSSSSTNTNVKSITTLTLAPYSAAVIPTRGNEADADRKHDADQTFGDAFSKFPVELFGSQREFSESVGAFLQEVTTLSGSSISTKQQGFYDAADTRFKHILSQYDKSIALTRHMFKSNKNSQCLLTALEKGRAEVVSINSSLQTLTAPEQVALNKLAERFEACANAIKAACDQMPEDVKNFSMSPLRTAISRGSVASATLYPTRLKTYFAFAAGQIAYNEALDTMTKGLYPDGEGESDIKGLSDDLHTAFVTAIKSIKDPYLLKVTEKDGSGVNAEWIAVVNAGLDSWFFWKRRIQAGIGAGMCVLPVAAFAYNRVCPESSDIIPRWLLPDHLRKPAMIATALCGIGMFGDASTWLHTISQPNTTLKGTIRGVDVELPCAILSRQGAGRVCCPSQVKGLENKAFNVVPLIVPSSVSEQLNKGCDMSAAKKK